MLAAPIESLESLTLDMPFDVSSANTGEAPNTPFKLTALLSRSGADKGDVANATPRSTAGTHFAAERDDRQIKNRETIESKPSFKPSLWELLVLLLCKDEGMQVLTTAAGATLVSIIVGLVAVSRGQIPLLRVWQYSSSSMADKGTGRKMYMELLYYGGCSFFIGQTDPRGCTFFEDVSRLKR